MCTYLSKAIWRQRIPLSHYSNLLDKGLSLKSVDFADCVHAQLIKVGFNRHTFLGNRCLDLYTKIAGTREVLKVFYEIADKNVISWNVCLKGLVKLGELSRARELFDEMPERDVVSWNSMISGLVSYGFVDSAMKCFVDMQSSGVRPSMYTYSTLLSFVSFPCHAKEIHGSTIRNGMFMSSVVIGNSLIVLYGEIGLISYAFGVFQNMEELDIISWNSLICSCSKANCQEMALEQFSLMRYMGYSPDGFTLSSIIIACSDLHYLDQGYKILACCVKTGLLSNSIVSSSAIDLFSKCGRLDDSISIFADVNTWSSAICNSMIASYARHGFPGEALDLFVSTLRKDISPTEFTISSVLCCASDLLPMVPGLQVHSLAVKLGLISDSVVASSLVDMYAKYGMIDSSLSIFLDMGDDERDLLCWNAMIMGLTRNGRIHEALITFNQMLDLGVQPDHVTFCGVLLACDYGDLVTEAINIFSAMEKQFSVTPVDEHYECVVALLCRAGKLKEAIDVVERMPYEPSSSIWKSILMNIHISEELSLIEKVSHKMMETNPRAYLPYLVLSRAYEIRAKWDSLARVNKTMKAIGVRKAKGCSWVGVRNHGFEFESDNLVHYGGLSTYLVLRLIAWEMQDQECQATIMD